MNKLNDIVFPNSYPSLDLHGYDRQIASVAVNDFILDNYKMGNRIVTIIHGVGTGILKEAVKQTLNKNKLVTEFKLDNFNIGMTIVEIKQNKND